MDTSIYYQAKFTSREKFNGISIPVMPLSIPSSASSSDLNLLLNKLLIDSVEDWTSLEFDFLIADELLRGTLADVVASKNLATESVIEIECILLEPSPVPELSMPHDDWVSAAVSFDQHFVTGCYDNSVHVWSTGGKHKCNAIGHAAPVKALAAVTFAENQKSSLQFLSASQDQTLMLWKYDVRQNAVNCQQIFRGHERSVECVCVNADSTRVASGGYDNLLKIWSTSEEDDTVSNEVKLKKHRKEAEGSSPLVKVPIVTLAGHREAVSGVAWSDKAEVMTCSWDHTIVVWDLELAGQKSVLPGRTVFTGISYSVVNSLLLSCSCDKFLRLWDPRAKDATTVKAKYSSHSGWISAVQWSTTKSNCFVSASYDKTSKMWDVRNSKAPLFDLTGHQDKVLCTNWNNPTYIVSGSADNTAKVYRLLS